MPPYQAVPLVYTVKPLFNSRYSGDENLQVPYHVCIVRGETDTESVGQLICQKADELRAALVAMAAHNKGRLVRFIVGSTTQYCIRHSHVTVLVMQNN